MGGDSGSSAPVFCKTYVDYVNKVKSIIYTTSRIYEHLEDKGLVWDMIKLEIRTQTISYCVKRGRQREEFVRDLNKKIFGLTQKKIIPTHK